MFKVIFFGTPYIASKCLESLLSNDNINTIEVIAVVTQPDKIVGRNKEIIHNATKKIAMGAGIKVFQPTKPIEIYDEIKKMSPDLIVTCAYGNIIPQKILDIPKYHCVNFHTSLLPKLRGGAPIQRAIINDEKETGVTLMYMDKGMDSGDIIEQSKFWLHEDETYSSLYARMVDFVYHMANNISRICVDNVKTTKQGNNFTLAPIITRQDEKINWNKTSREIDCLVRGLYDSPCAYTTYNGVEIKVLKVSIGDKKSEPGKIISYTKVGLEIGSKDGSILIKELQISGKKKTDISSFYNGNNTYFKIGSLFS